jgi:hypothetical protein
MEQNLHETTSRWKTYGRWLFSEDLKVRDVVTNDINEVDYGESPMQDEEDIYEFNLLSPPRQKIS